MNKKQRVAKKKHDTRTRAQKAKAKPRQAVARRPQDYRVEALRILTESDTRRQEPGPVPPGGTPEESPDWIAPPPRPPSKPRT